MKKYNRGYSSDMNRAKIGYPLTWTSSCEYMDSCFALSDNSLPVSCVSLLFWVSAMCRDDWENSSLVCFRRASNSSTRLSAASTWGGGGEREGENECDLWRCKCIIINSNHIITTHPVPDYTASLRPLQIIIVITIIYISSSLSFT